SSLMKIIIFRYDCIAFPCGEIPNFFITCIFQVEKVYVVAAREVLREQFDTSVREMLVEEQLHTLMRSTTGVLYRLRI
ncbi:MAG: hypothetical protein MK080_08710, partial [Opitutales bacterium]|nr:hypothetical protein [Opitutales bacterium]